MDNYILKKYEKTELKNGKLATAFNNIIKCINDGQKASEKVARVLKNIKDDELWVEDYESFAECIATFGIGKAQAYRVINAVEVKDSLEDLANYTISQVAELARLENSEICTLIDFNKISQDMTCKQLREVVDEWKHADELPEEVEEIDEEPEETEEPEDTEETDDEQVKIHIEFGDYIYDITSVAEIRGICKLLKKYGYTV